MPRSITRNALLALAAAAFSPLAGCDVDVKDSGQLPDVDVSGGKAPEIDVKPGEAPDVDVAPGRAPDIDVKGPDVDVTTKEETVTVPDVDVDVKSKEKTITVPDIDINVPGEDDNEARPESGTE